MTKKGLWSRWGLEVTLRCERALAWSRRASRAMARPGVLVALILVLVLVPLCVMIFKPAAKAGPDRMVKKLKRLEISKYRSLNATASDPVCLVNDLLWGVQSGDCENANRGASIWNGLGSWPILPAR